MEQTIINWLLGGFGTLLGFLLNAVWQAVKDLQKTDQALVQKFSELEVLVAGNYVRKEELQDNIKALFAKLDRIEDKLDRKVDR